MRCRNNSLSKQFGGGQPRSDLAESQGFLVSDLAFFGNHGVADR